MMVSKYTGNPDVERARKQTVEEWLEEYTTGIPVEPGSLKKAIAQAKLEHEASNSRLLYKYVVHRTIRRGGLILAFKNLETYEEAISFFNVELNGNHRRGIMRYISFRTGARGEFYPKEGSNFRKFWMRTIGRKPRSWSRAHLELRARLKNLTFTGEIKQNRDSHSVPYKELLNPRVI